MNKTYCPCDECGYSYSKQNQEDYTCKICEFEMMLELKKKGRLLELPCAVGDTVYAAFDGGNYKHIVRGILFRENKVFAQDGNGSVLGEFWKTIFLTRKEAKAALKEMSEVTPCEEDATLACAEHA